MAPLWAAGGGGGVSAAGTMDEAYDVIVLGTGLTVSVPSSPSPHSRPPRSVGFGLCSPLPCIPGSIHGTPGRGCIALRRAWASLPGCSSAASGDTASPLRWQPPSPFIALAVDGEQKRTRLFLLFPPLGGPSRPIAASLQQTILCWLCFLAGRKCRAPIIFPASDLGQ